MSARLSLGPIAAAAIAALLFAAGCQSVGERLVYSADPRLSGQLCRPDGPGPFPAVVFNHGGVGDIIGGDPLGSCAALAKAGYVGFSPIRRLTRTLVGHGDDVDAAIAKVKSLPYVDAGRLGLIGFSRGGMLTLLAATTRNDLKAVVIMATASGGRGQLSRGMAEAARISAPVLLLVAENDTGSRTSMGFNTMDGMRGLERALKDAGKDVRLVVYPAFGGDGHQLFFSVGSYWKDVTAFLAQHL